MKTKILLIALILILFFIIKNSKKMAGKFKEPSERIKNFIKKYESFEAKAYKDAAGLWTIGWGTLIEKRPDLYKRFVTDGKKISEEDAEILFNDDVKSAADTVKRFVKVNLNQNEGDSLTSFVYNVGSGNFQKSTLLKKLNANDRAGAAEEFTRWKFANGKELAGLLRRRIDEQKIFLNNYI